MERGNDSEREMRELFGAARRVDRESVPDFVSMRVSARERTRRSTATRALRFALMSATATVSIAALAMWIAVKSPTAIVPEAPAPTASWDTAAPVVLPDLTPEAAMPAAAPDPLPTPAPPEPPVAPPQAAVAAPPSPAAPVPRKFASQPEVRHGGLSVSVRGSDGGPLPGATVTISHDRGLVKTSASLTDRTGTSVFPVLQPGSGYALLINFPGFAPKRQEGLTVSQGQNVEIPVQLSSEIVERVKVTSMKQVIDLETTETVHGARDRHFAAMVGGVKNIDPLTGQFMSRVNPNSIEEIEVISAGGGVQFGRAQGGFNTESYSPIVENDFRAVTDHPLSTFSIDVDTGSYANVRRFLKQGQLPPHDAVRIEELINYFRYDYPPPEGDAPFSADVEVADCPWNADHLLARIGLKGRQVSRGDFVGSNLVFLIDVSGSMQPPNKLPLLKSALSLLVDQLDGRDQVAIVVYAGAAGLVLPSTSGASTAELRSALERLSAGGSTNGGQGIQLAYKIARKNFIPGGINRVILATDGDFNVGVTNRTALLKQIKHDANEGIFLTTLGFGNGNYKDDMLERLADEGNGNYSYIDNLREARKVLVEQIAGTLVTIAKDVKIQVEFNPRQVAGYRLIGYENRMLRKEDFNDDLKDAGEIGAGHTVTALYEVVPADGEVSVAGVDPLRYQQAGTVTEAAESGELFTLKLRYKDPQADTSKLLSFPVLDEGRTLAGASKDFKFASAVACFGMILRESRYAGNELLDQVRNLALEGGGPDEQGYRAGFRRLIDKATPLIEQRDAD